MVLHKFFCTLRKVYARCASRSLWSWEIQWEKYQNVLIFFSLNFTREYHWEIVSEKLKCVHTSGKIQFLMRNSVRNSFSHWWEPGFTKQSVTQRSCRDTGTEDFLIAWKILLLNLFSAPLLCWLWTERWCHEKFLLDTKMQRASHIYFLGSESVLSNVFNPFQINISIPTVKISNTFLYKVQRIFLCRNQSLNWKAKTHLISFKSMFHTYTLKNIRTYVFSRVIKLKYWIKMG